MPSPRPSSVKRHALAHHKSEYFAPRRAERQSHADLTRALSDAEREHPVEADGRKQQRACTRTH